jgi:hypothetical protein
VQPDNPTDNISTLNNFDDTNDVDSNLVVAELDDIQLHDTSVVDASLSFCFGKKDTAQFSEWCIAGTVTQATHCIVQQSLLQSPVSSYLHTPVKLPPHSIHLFLHIASFMLMTTGQTHHDTLSNILVLVVFALTLPDYKEWPTMPSTIAWF